MREDFHDFARLAGSSRALQPSLPAAVLRAARCRRFCRASCTALQGFYALARSFRGAPVGSTATDQRVVLDQDRSPRSAFSANTHHPCLGSQRALPYSADRGKKSVNRQALDELKQQIPLMGYLQAHDWSPSRPLSGGRWMGLCPLHEDHKPSFLVDTNKDLFYCYGCGRGGDVIRFAELYHQVKFLQAVGLLRQWRGAEPLLNEASRFYRVQLHRHSEAVAYLYQRGIRSWATIELMRIGYAPGGLPARLVDAVGAPCTGSAPSRSCDQPGIRRLCAAHRFPAGRQSLWP